MDNVQKVKASLSNFQNIDENFSRGSVKVMYVGRNRNGSHFTRQAVEDALGSLKNMPVVGEWSDEREDYKGHGGKIVLTDDDIKMIPTTRPWGVIPESFSHEWVQEDIGEGRTKETLVIHDVILWTAHYEQALSALLKNSSQSMEIEIVDGEWNEELEIYDVKKFNFLSLCILGENVEPAFENSHFYSLDKKAFQKEFHSMLHELSFSLSTESNKEVNKLPEELKEKGVKEEDLELDKTKTDETFEEGEKSEDEKPEDAEKSTEETPIPSNDETIKDTAMEDNETDKSPANPAQPAGEENPVVIPSVEYEEKIANLQKELDTLKSEFKAIKDEKEVLEAFKLQTEKDAHEEASQKLFARLKLTSEDVKDLDVQAFSISDLEKECYSIIGRNIATGKNFSIEDKEQDVKTKIKTKNTANSDSELDELFAKYSK